MRVLKFGGTSLAGRSRIEEVAGLVRASALETGVIVVVSAMAGITNRLVALVDAAKGDESGCREEIEAIEGRHLVILDGLPRPCREPAAAEIRAVAGSLRTDLEALELDPPNREELRDRVLAAGERLSVQLVTASLQSLGCPARAIDGADLVATDSGFGEAKVDFDLTRTRCRRRLNGRDTGVTVVTGFVGSDDHGRTTTLGRGGSDYSAALLGAALDVDRVEIWTDVDGVLTAPPMLVPGVSSIPWLSYEEAAELSFYGARVLHPRTVRPLAERGIPIHVRNTLAPARPGTEIATRTRSPSRVAAVSAFEDVTVLRVRGHWVGAEAEVLLSCRASSDGATLVAVPTQRSGGLIEELVRQRGLPLEHHYPASIIGLVGHDIGLQPWVAGRALESLARRGISVLGFAAGAGPHTVTLLVDRDDLSVALGTIHGALMLDRGAGQTAPSGPSVGSKEIRQVSAA